MWDIHNILWLFFTETVILMSLQMPQKFRALIKGNIITLSTACLFFLHFYNVYICKKIYIYRARKISKSLVALWAGTLQILVARKLIHLAQIKKRPLKKKKKKKVFVYI